jgi:hypothetical protein
MVRKHSKSEAVNRRTDISTSKMGQRRQAMNHNTLHRNLQFEFHESLKKKTGMDGCSQEGYAAISPLVALVVLIHGM